MKIVTWCIWRRNVYREDAKIKHWRLQNIKWKHESQKLEVMFETGPFKPGLSVGLKHKLYGISDIIVSL